MRRNTCFIIVTALLLFICSGADAAPKHTLRLGHSVPTENPYHAGAEKFKEIVEKKTGGDVVINIFPNGQLGTGERDLIEGMQLGTVDIYVGSTGPMGGFEKKFLLFDFPFLFKDRKHAFSVLDGEIGQYIMGLLDAKGIHGLAWLENGFRNLTNGKRPVNTPADAAGLKVRTMENKVHMAMWRALGADPTPMAWSEVFTALQQGTIDGQENPISVIYTSKIYEAQKHLALTRHVFSPAMIIIAKPLYDKLPADYRKIIAEAATEAALHQRKICEKNESVLIEALKKSGMQITTPDPKPFQEACKGVYDQFRKELGKDASLLDKITSESK